MITLRTLACTGEAPTAACAPAVCVALAPLPPGPSREPEDALDPCRFWLCPWSSVLHGMCRGRQGLI